MLKFKFFCVILPFIFFNAGDSLEIQKNRNDNFVLNTEKVVALDSKSIFEPNSTGQSPIPLSSGRSYIVVIERKIRFENYDQILNDWMILNDGYTAKIGPTHFVKGPQAPSIVGYGLPGRFVAQSFHFHWGSNDTQGSEHTLEGSRYSLEVHIVHVNEKYSSMEEAKGKPDGVAVVGLLYYADFTSITSDPFRPIADQLSQVVAFNQTVSLGDTFRLSNITSRGYFRRYYSYSGSMTTPDYTENVSWIVTGMPTQVSQEFLNVLRTLKGRDGQFLSNNYRALQPIGGRIVRDVAVQF